MRKLLFIILMLFLAFGVFAQNEEEREEKAFSVAYWVGVSNPIFQRRASNELESSLLNSTEWNFVIAENTANADIHIILNGLEIAENAGYAWSISFTPIFQPLYNNSTVATSEANIGGINWVARKAAEFVENQLFIILDNETENNENNNLSEENKA